MSNRIEEIDELITQLQEEREELVAKGKAPWPRRVTTYLHSSKESNYEDGEGLGLTDNALQKFAYACCEVAIELEVWPDGRSCIVGVDGKKFQET